MRIVVGEGSCGIAAGAEDVRKELVGDVSIAGCIGMCYLEPIVDLYESDELRARLVKVSAKDAPRISEAAASGDLSLVRDLLISPEDEEFLKKQTRIALRNCGIVDPESIASYRARGGYQALEKARKMTGEEIIEEIRVSWLAGRGGAGFPTYFKWAAARKATGEEKYLVCNADEGDPGAFMDRAIIESDPHSLIEGMLIAARAIGAKRAFVYVRAEYPLAISRLKLAISEAERSGVTGDVELEIRAGAGAFVCGEETALIESLEGSRGMPRLKPPFPAERGYRSSPTNVNNVETFANVPWILLNGGAALAKLGTENSKGTKVFALTGKIERGGLVEVPMGKTLREVIFDIGGGIRDNRRFKAVQLGGPSGGCIPESLLDTRIDYRELARTGAIMGSGGMVVMDETTDMVEMARFFLEFTARESCGKCVPCRIGTKRLFEQLTALAECRAKEGALELIEELARGIKENSLCGLGQTATNPVLTTLKYFHGEYERRMEESLEAAKRVYVIRAASCKGCGACKRKCPVQAIKGKPRSPHTINVAACLKCGACKKACKFGAIDG